MSKILDLAKTFEHNSNEQRNNIEKTVTREYATLERHLELELKESAKNIASDIKKHQQAVHKAALSNSAQVIQHSKIKWYVIAAITTLLIATVPALTVHLYYSNQLTVPAQKLGQKTIVICSQVARLKNEQIACLPAQQQQR